MAGKKKKRASRWDVLEPVVSADPPAAPPPARGLGTAIEAVRVALEPFDVPTRKKIVRAVSTLLR